MKEEILWLEKAMRDLKAAENSLKSKDYDWSCFQAQQSIEKGLKALNIKELKEIIKTHDLVLLARKINAPENIIILCSEINPAYTDTRYPETSKLYGKTDAEKALDKSKEIMKWIKTNL